METGYLILFIVGFLLVGFTFLVGELFEFGGELAHEIEGHIDIGTDHGLEAQGVDSSTPSPFSSRIAAVLVTVFGGIGFIGSQSGWSDGWTLVLAFASAFAAAVGVYFIVVLPLARQQGSTKVERSTFLGLEGQVAIAIPSMGLGQVALFVPSSNTRVTESASSTSGVPIPFGTRVVVDHVGPSSIGVKIIGAVDQNQEVSR